MDAGGDELGQQYEQWARAKAGFEMAFVRLRRYNIHELAARIFEYNLCMYHSLFAQAASRASRDPQLAANLVALVASQLDSEGEKVVQSILYAAKTQLSAFGGALESTQPILVCAHLLVLRSIDAWPLFQLLVCLCRDKKFRLVSDVMAICGPELKEASADSYEYIKRQIGSHQHHQPTVDIVLDQYKRLVKCDVESVQEPSVQFSQLAAVDWEPIRAAILGEESDDESDDNSDGESEQEEQSEQENKHRDTPTAAPAQTHAVNVQLQKTIYLTLMSSISSKEACHKLVALGNRPLVVKMLLEACKQEKIYNKNFSTIGHTLCKTGTQWKHELEKSFGVQYAATEQLSTKEIRHLGTFYGFMLATNSLDWSVLQVARLNPDESTPSTRIFLQALFEEMRREIGLAEMKVRLMPIAGLFPQDLAGLRFCINFFTAIKMGPLTDEPRKQLKRLEAPQEK